MTANSLASAYVFSLFTARGWGCAADAIKARTYSRDETVNYKTTHINF